MVSLRHYAVSLSGGQPQLYSFDGNAVFLFGVIYSSYIVAKKVSETFPNVDPRRNLRRHMKFKKNDKFLRIIIISELNLFSLTCNLLPNK